MIRLSPFFTAFALVLAAGSAQAAQVCGTNVRISGGEASAHFGAVSAFCGRNGSCTAFAAIAAPGHDGTIAQRLRITLRNPGADPRVELSAGSPAAIAGRPMSLTFLGQSMNLARIARPVSRGSNTFRITDGIAAKSIVSGARRQAVVRWTYTAQDGPVDAYFSLVGMSRALAWIDCMGARRARPQAQG